MNYYRRTQQILAARAALSGVRMSQLGYLHALGQTDTTVESPAGTILRYKGTFIAPATRVFTGSTGPELVSMLGTQLSSMGEAKVIGSNADQPTTGQQRTIYLTLQDLIGHQSKDDLRSVVDGVIFNTGRKIVQSSIAILPGADETGFVDQTQPPPGGADTGQWIKNNWGWLAIGAAGLIFVSEVL